LSQLEQIGKGLGSKMDDIVAMLKEQEAVEPKHNPLSPTDWFCGKCGMCISRFHDYCPSCGQAVKWE
jgi:rubrerythrin